MWQSLIGGKAITLANQGGMAEGIKGDVAEGTVMVVREQLKDCKPTTANTYQELSPKASINPDSTALLFTNKLYFTTCTLALTLDL
ncbi:UNVERIFIED_CONTAM: hypothetical protein FKN15_015018 [Acipenser sinensis]